MKVTRIDHVAVCVEGVDAALGPWLSLFGLGRGPREVVTPLATEAAFLLTPDEGGACVELIAPAGDNPGLRKFLAGNQGRSGLHHIAFAVDDLARALTELAERQVPLLDRVPRLGARGHQVGFLHPSATGGVLVELVAETRQAQPKGPR